MLYKKTKHFTVLGLKLIGAFLGASVLYVGTSHLFEQRVVSIAGDRIEAIRAELDGYKNLENERSKIIEETKKIELHIVKSMELSRAKLSDAQRASITRVLTSVAMKEFSNFEQRELWIAVIANESKFNPTAVSHAGAIGLGQVMPASGKWYAERCGLEEVTKQDLYDPFINSMISACIFHSLLEKTDGSPSLALVGYNAGEFSKDIKRLENMVNINNESANYLAKISRFLEKTREVNISSK